MGLYLCPEGGGYPHGIQNRRHLSDREDARWISTHNGLENILTVSDRARMNNMVKTIDSVVRSNAGDVSATATALGVLDGAGIIVNGLMSSELNATILRISEPMHLEKGKAYTVHIVDDDPPAPYSMFFYRTTSSACLQQGGTNRGVSAIGGRFEQVIPDTTGDYQMGIYATGAVFSNHLIHAYMYEGQDWSADDFYAYPKSDTLAAVISEMAAVKDDVRKKNLVRMLGNKGFLDGTGVYRLNSIGMPDPAGIMLNGTFGTASTTTYTNISEVFHLEAGQSYRVGWMQRGPIVFQRKIRTTDMRSRARILCGCSIRAVAGTEQDPTGCRVLSIRSRDS